MALTWENAPRVADIPRDFRISTIEQGGLSMMLPTAYDYKTTSETNTLSRLSFTPSGRELDAELSYSTLLGDGWLGTNLFVRRQPGHIASADADAGAAIRYSLDF